jgi:hypothetical protein
LDKFWQILALIFWGDFHFVLAFLDVCIWLFKKFSVPVYLMYLFISISSFHFPPHIALGWLFWVFLLVLDFLVAFLGCAMASLLLVTVGYVFILGFPLVSLFWCFGFSLLVYISLVQTLYH